MATDDRPRVPTRVPVRAWIGVIVTLVIVVPLAGMWWNSRLPSTYTVMDMGVPTYGGGPRPSASHMAGMSMPGNVSVTQLDTPKGRKADVVVELTARQGTVRLA